MSNALESAITALTEIQSRAVAWDQGALLLLAGPGSGKTQVLTCRIARLLDSSRDKNFRVLALTFTNKAADEMKARVANFVPGLEERANIGTFHSFCSQVLRQHGVHLGIKPDFSIYSLDDDRKAVLADALQQPTVPNGLGADDVRFLGLIDRMKARLIGPEAAEAALARYDYAARVAQVYRLYEDELRRLNALDFNSLVFEAYRLATTFPALAARYRRSHPFWLIDEFQDTNSGQYRLVKAFAGADFKNIFAVADDDQIIYQWNGANFRHIQAFLHDFSAELIQLPTNYRCPPAIVDAANRLVAYNVNRSADKKPLLAGKKSLKHPEAEHIRVLEFDTDADEAAGVADEIAGHDREDWGNTAVIGRSRAILEKMLGALQERHVPAVITQRRDQFLSPHFRWLCALLAQTIRPLDKRNFALVVDAFNRIVGQELNPDQIAADAEATGRGYFASWLATARASVGDGAGAKLLALAAALPSDGSNAKAIVTQIVAEFSTLQGAEGENVDLAEDASAWRELTSGIARHLGRDAPLDQFLQELQLRSKEPTPKPGTVALMTVHGAKGREFDYVYVVGLAEDVMPSYQSRKQGDNSPEMEEERRNCFVAITRTKECLVLSRADNYRGWKKAPSRFLVEMDLVA